MSNGLDKCSGSCESCGESCGDGMATITLTLDNDETIECVILTYLNVSGKDYIALLPLNEDGKTDDNDVFIYRYITEGSEPGLENIQDDEEYEAVADAFDEWLDTLEFNGLVGKDEDAFDEDETPVQ